MDKKYKAEAQKCTCI